MLLSQSGSPSTSWTSSASSSKYFSKPTGEMLSTNPVIGALGADAKRSLRQLGTLGGQHGLLLAAVGRALDFATWRSLVRDQGLGDERALEIMVCAVCGAGLTEARLSLCYSPNLPDEGRGRESPGGWGRPSQRPPKVKGLRKQSESLRQKDRGPEGVLESSIWLRWIGADGVTLSGLGQGGKRQRSPDKGV
jgi:hypothetical protein